MKVTMLLADYAQAAEGKLNIIGGGWSQIGPEPTPFSIGLKFDVPWDQANHRFTFVLELVDADGTPVELPGAEPDGDGGPVRVEGELEVGRPPGLRPGTPIDAVLAINFGPLPLPPGERLAFRLTVDGEHDEDWTLGFDTRPAPEPTQQ